MANKVKIARSGGASGHTAVTAPSNGDLEYGELGWLNGTNRLFIGRATANPVTDPEEATYEITRTATATKTGMAGFDSGEFDISAFDASDGTGGIVSIKDSGVANAHLAGSIANGKLANSSLTIGSTQMALGGTTTSFAGLENLDITAGDRQWAASLGANTLTLGHVDGTVAIAGDLTVAGTTTTISSTNLEITDKKLELGKGSANQAALDGIGIYCDPTTGTDVQLLVSTSGTKWTSNVPIVATGFEGPLTGNASSATTAAALTGTQASAITANTAKVGTEGLATSRMLGNFDPGAGAVAVTAAQVRTFLNVADGATNTTDTNTWRPITAGGNTLTGAETLAFTAGSNVTIAEASGAVTITAANDNTWRGVTAGGNTLTASETLAFTAGSNITIAEAGGAVTITATDTDTQPRSDEYIQDVVGAMFSSNTETRITATYQDGDGTIDLAVDAFPTGDITSVVAGAGMTGGATSGDATVNCVGGTGITVTADSIDIDGTVLTTASVLDGGTPTWS